MDLDQVLKAALALPPSARARLVAELMASIDEGPDLDDPAYFAEIQRRADDVVSGRVEGIPWPAVREKMEALLKKK